MIFPEEGRHYAIERFWCGISGMALEPNFLFSKEILQIAIPEMLSQTGTSGRQFAHCSSVPTRNITKTIFPI